MQTIGRFVLLIKKLIAAGKNQQNWFTRLLQSSKTEVRFPSCLIGHNVANGSPQLQYIFL